MPKIRVIIYWKLPFISSSLIMSHLKVPVVQIKVEAKTLKQYVLVVWKLDILFSMCLVPMCKIKKFHHKPWSGRKSGHFLNNWSVCPSCYSFNICFQFRCPDLGIVSLSVVYAAHCNALVGVWGKIWSRLQGVLFLAFFRSTFFTTLVWCLKKKVARWIQKTAYTESETGWFPKKKCSF